MSDDDVELLAATLSAAMAAGQKVSVPAERMLELRSLLLVARMERDEARAAAKAAGQQWVPCAERMPDDFVDVLVWHSEMSEAWVTCRRPWIDHNGRRVRSYWDDDSGSQPAPTHWRPLPAPPKGDQR